MLSFELAKKLKDAGFPMNPHRRWDLSDFYFNPESGDERNEREKVWIPTLSELIEACGDKFSLLAKGEDGWGALGGTITVARYNDSKTPEEAVANLWLALKVNYEFEHLKLVK